ncbi:unnamed protein product, partial [Brachionus calyciflorus]
NVLEKPNKSELSEDSSIEELDVPKHINDDDIELELDLLNESTKSLSLKENLLSNINQTIEENTSLFKNFAQKSFEIQNKLIENQTKSIQLLEQMLSKSEKSESINACRQRDLANDDSNTSDDENDKFYVTFMDSFITLLRKKVPESALNLDIKTLKLIYPDEMNEIEGKN